MPNKSKNKKLNPNASVLLAVIISCLLAFPVGYLLGESAEDKSTIPETAIQKEDMSEHSHDGKSENNQSHLHSIFEIPEGSPVPEIENLKITKDIKSGWNLSFGTKNFTFSPERASGEHIYGEGHAHLYIDEEKITRLYSNNYYLGDLEEGEHTIKITLNTNDHKDYTYNGEVISASQTVTDMHHN